MLDKCGLTPDKISQWEVNEPFGLNPLAFMKFFDIGPKNINIKGGAVAFGHPLATNGGRILNSLIRSLKPGELGVAAICNGCGEGCSMLIRGM
ncbi:unnamed protein product [Anisakis simplex]|uniref:Acetyl-CoA acetyltransferase, mitochondrial (inferred by orthology to a human protein) n=1 Tax=Anisakis simplex TaxID=6269 RepID=A0A0M3IZD0_ANISI|nr:unnamed protein product [Anisakis simplex]